jgi:hypothetical protein
MRHKHADQQLKQSEKGVKGNNVFQAQGERSEQKELTAMRQHSKEDTRAGKSTRRE